MPIAVGTIQQIHDANHRLATYCPGCQKHGPWLELPKLIAKGIGDKRPREVRLRCAKCGSGVKLTLHPPGGPGGPMSLS